MWVRGFSPGWDLMRMGLNCLRVFDCSESRIHICKSTGKQEPPPRESVIHACVKKAGDMSRVAFMEVKQNATHHPGQQHPIQRPEPGES
jgi:hypothetical protein